MSAFRFRFFFRDNTVRRFWNTWTRNYLINSVVRKFRRDRSVKDVLECFKQVILRPKRTLLLTATAVCKGREDSFPCEQGISDSELQALLDELEGLQKLAKLTVYCTSCGKRLVIDRKQNGVSYCVCKDSKPSQTSSDGWVPYMEAVDVIIWRKEYKPGTGQYAYKVYGRYPEVSASDFAAVQIDGAYRKAWDNAVAALSVVQRGAHGIADQAVMHWEVLWPRLFANRDYVYIRRHKEFELKSPKSRKEDTFEFSSVHAKARRKSREIQEKERDHNKVYIILSKACEHPDVPVTKHAIRVTEYWSHMVVKTINGSDKPGMEFVLTYYDEPAVGGMPGGVAAWASSRAAPDYLLKMRKAATNYRTWVQGRGKEELQDFTPFGPDQVSYEEKTGEVREQDMESSKLGPELDHEYEKKDKETQTDITSDDIKMIKFEKPNTEDKQERRETEKPEKEKKSEEKRENENEPKKEQGDLKGEETNTEEKPGKKDCEDEDINNGSWWRYLYPFYYFV